MGTFAETAIVDDRLLFADQEQHNSVFRLCWMAFAVFCET
jgi:hypothetical protein